MAVATAGMFRETTTIPVVATGMFRETNWGNYHNDFRGGICG